MTRIHSMVLFTAVATLLFADAANAGRCPNLLLDFDVSGSMGTQVSGSTQDRYQVGRDAVKSLLNGNTANFRYGLELFGTGGSGSCAVSTCYYPAANCESVLAAGNSAPAIAAVLDARTSYSGSTPTATSITTAVGRTDMQDTTRNRYIILITDGDPNCTNNTLQDTLNALTSAKNSGVKTYVLGFAGGTAANLNDMAIAGGTQRFANCDSGANKCYYDASNANDLNTALAAIVSAVGGELGGGACDDTCYGSGCPSGQICKTGAGGTPSCVANPCAGTSCPAGAYCVEGQCKVACAPACLSNEYCDNGVCKARTATTCTPACATSRQTCINGQCQENYCDHPTAAIACSGAQICLDNACQDFGGGTGGGTGSGGGAGGKDGGSGGGSGTNAATGCCSGAPGATSLFGLLAGLSTLAAMRRRVRR